MKGEYRVKKGEALDIALALSPSMSSIQRCRLHTGASPKFKKVANEKNP
jgi:hypothetical protein